MAQQHFLSYAVAAPAAATASAATQAALLVLPGNANNAQPSGIDISHCEAVTAVLSAAAGQTITAAGVLRCYVMMPTNAAANAEADPSFYRWFPYPTLDYVLVGGQRDEAIGDKQSLTGIGRIVWLPDAVGFSGGTTCQMTHMARRRRG